MPLNSPKNMAFPNLSRSYVTLQTFGSLKREDWLVLMLSLFYVAPSFSPLFGGRLFTHLPTAVLVFCMVLSVMKAEYIVTREVMVALLVLAIVLLQSVLLLDQEAVLYAGSYLGGLLAYIHLFRNRAPNLLVWYVICLFLLFPLFLLKGNLSAALPLPQNGFRINWGPRWATAHYTGIAGLLLAVVSSCAYFATRKKVHLAVLLLSIYLVLFSGARSAYLGLCVFAVLCLLNGSVYRPRLSFLTVLLAVATVYMVPMFQEHLPVFKGALGKLTKLDGRWNITSWRVWLWKYHLGLFSSHPFTGVGLEPLRFLTGTYAYGELVKTGSESFFTKALAAWGLSGLLFPALQFYLFGSALKKERFIGVVCGAVMIVLTVANSTFGNIYGIFNPFVFAVVAGCLGSGGEHASEEEKSYTGGSDFEVRKQAGAAYY